MYQSFSPLKVMFSLHITRAMMGERAQSRSDRSLLESLAVLYVAIGVATCCIQDRFVSGIQSAVNSLDPQRLGKDFSGFGHLRWVCGEHACRLSLEIDSLPHNKDISAWCTLALCQLSNSHYQLITQLINYNYRFLMLYCGTELFLCFSMLASLGNNIFTIKIVTFWRSRVRCVRHLHRKSTGSVFAFNLSCSVHFLCPGKFKLFS